MIQTIKLKGYTGINWINYTNWCNKNNKKTCHLKSIIEYVER